MISLKKVNKPKFTFAGEDFSGALSCVLEGDFLFLLYSCNEDKRLGETTMLKKVNLKEFDGDEWSLPNLYERKALLEEAVAEGLFKFGDYLILHRMVPEVIGSQDGAVIYSERDGFLDSEGRVSKTCWLRSFKEDIYRGDISPSLGVDVINVHSRTILRHIELDILGGGGG
jgi:hypothetical protein